MKIIPIDKNKSFREKMNDIDRMIADKFPKQASVDRELKEVIYEYNKYLLDRIANRILR